MHCVIANNSIALRELSPKQRAAVSALAVGLSVKAAAEAAGVSAVTVSRWRRLPVFNEAVRRELEVITHQQGERLLGTVRSGVTRLRKLIHDPDGHLALSAVRLLFQTVGLVGSDNPAVQINFQDPVDQMDEAQVKAEIQRLEIEIIRSSRCVEDAQRAEARLLEAPGNGSAPAQEGNGDAKHGD